LSDGFKRKVKFILIKMYLPYLKRLLDIIASLTGLILLLPFLLFIAIVLLLLNKNNPFFFQERGGFRGSVFKIIKFKTMSDKKDKNGILLHDYKRITKFGRFLRNHSIDELPQLVNILKGDMSLIGPRPLLTSYKELYSEHQIKRHNVKPGISGWAQINGRNSLTWKEKFELDIYYVENQCFKLDFFILLKTFKKVIIPSHVNNSEEATAPMFNGKN